MIGISLVNLATAPFRLAQALVRRNGVSTP